MKHLSEYGPEFTKALNNIKLRIGKDKPKKDRFMEDDKEGAFAEWCSLKGWQYFGSKPDYWENQFKIIRTTSELLEIFRNRKENEKK